MQTTGGAPTLDFPTLWRSALEFDRFVAESKENRALWEGVYRTAQLPEWALARATALSGRPRLLAIVEDWCGDGSSTVPVLAKLADASEKLALRVIRRDENLDVMSRYLTDGTRSIPIVIVLDEAFRELGHWGPRPHELQQWVTDHKATMPKEERYRYVRGWYARDRGETMLREVLALVG